MCKYRIQYSARMCKCTGSNVITIGRNKCHQFSKCKTVVKNCKNSGQIALQQPEIVSIVVELQLWFPEVLLKGKPNAQENIEPHKSANKSFIKAMNWDLKINVMIENFNAEIGRAHV